MHRAALQSAAHAVPGRHGSCCCHLKTSRGTEGRKKVGTQGDKQITYEKEIWTQEIWDLLQISELLIDYTINGKNSQHMN